jgi:hypothetical protein
MSRPLSLALIVATAALGACLENQPGIPIEEEDGVQAASLLSSVNVADPEAEPQLLRGFHGLEQRAWRWTERKFGVMLQPPPPGQPVVLNLSFTLPGVVTDAVGAVTITARVNGQAIGSQTFAEPGENKQFEAAVSDGLLTGQPAEVELELDKAMPPSERDPRELGIVVFSVSFQ